MAGWALGYIRLPYLEDDHSFWIGFLGGIGSLVLVISLWRLSARKSLWSDEEKGGSPDQVHRRGRVIRLMLMLVLTILAISCFNLYQMNRELAEEVEDCRRQVKESQLKMDSLEQSRWMTLMQDVLMQAEKEAGNSDGSLSDKTLNRIAAANLQLKPFGHVDSAGGALSPQRGQLLLALLNMELDDTTWTKLKQRVSFECADLRNASLEGADLSNAKLSGAHFSKANLDQANLSRADLSYALLDGVKGEGVDFFGSNLKRARMEWSELKNANFTEANLDGVNAGNANWTGARLDSASMQWVHFEHLFCQSCSSSGTNATGADFTAANFSRSVMTDIYWKQSKLEDLLLDGAQVDSSFFDRVELFPGVTGLENVRARYELKSDTLTNAVVYRLTPR